MKRGDLIKAGIMFLTAGFSLLVSGTDPFNAGSRLCCIDLPVPGKQQVSNGMSQSETAILKHVASFVRDYYRKADTAGLRSFSDSLLNTRGLFSQPDSSFISEIYYYAGFCKMGARDYDGSLTCFKRSVLIKETIGEVDDHYMKGLYNTAIVYYELSDFQACSEYLLKYINLGERFFIAGDSKIVDAYMFLIAAANRMQEPDKVEGFISDALAYVDRAKVNYSPKSLVGLYHNIGMVYFAASDMAKSRVYLEKAQSVHDRSNFEKDEFYINILNSLAIVYGSLGLSEKESGCVNEAIDLAFSRNSFIAFNTVYSYALELAKSGKVQKGEKLFGEIVERAGNIYGRNSRDYIYFRCKFAEYLLNYSNNVPRALGIFSDCAAYLENGSGDLSFRERALTMYADALLRNGELYTALGVVQELLLDKHSIGNADSLFFNPSPDSLGADKRILDVLRVKYEILWKIFSGSGNLKVLEAAANTSGLMISLIDRIRINISEEESRIILGDRYRELYFRAIRDHELCFRLTGEPAYLEKAFTFSERGKVAGLLAATRELNAVQFHLPTVVAGLEKSLLRDISYCNSRISLEYEKDNPDNDVVTHFREKLLRAINKRDSLVNTLEKEFPEYYRLKYNNKVLKMSEVPAIVGRNANYLSYVMSDSALYIFIVNRKHSELSRVAIDSAFRKVLMDFRSLLSDVNVFDNARAQFDYFQEIGTRLYKILIEPVAGYFISDKLIISPDNLISYLPFETLLTSKYYGMEIMYRKLNYLMKDYDISYTYSATFMEEIRSREMNRQGDLVAFAPYYTGRINLDTVFMKRQSTNSVLLDLPYAREEAEYVSGISGGDLFVNDDARESVFKSRAGNYDIIHLAMHTYLDDQNPMNSAMIFTRCDDAPEDGLLHTYEIYGIPLKSRMVVLSSCNTGSGVMSTGEGILSLARGFIYSGSRSVVMSMWEVEDKSGTEIIKLFYDNLEKGHSKSRSLKRARNRYLVNASQKSSHPYYWSTLVIYGDDSPVHTRWELIAAAVVLIITACGLPVYYLLKRRYS